MIAALQTELAEVKASKADRSEVRSEVASVKRTVILMSVIGMVVHLIVQARKTESARPISTGSQSVTVGASRPDAAPHSDVNPAVVGR